MQDSPTSSIISVNLLREFGPLLNGLGFAKETDIADLRALETPFTSVWHSPSNDLTRDSKLPSERNQIRPFFFALNSQPTAFDVMDCSFLIFLTR